jgi:hypothetical protein
MPAHVHLEQEKGTKGDKMKTRTISILAVVLVLGLSTLVSAASVTPVQTHLVTGDAAKECGQLTDENGQALYDFAYKVDNPANNGVYGPEAGQTITILNSDGYIFDWTVTPYPLGAVLVKAGSPQSCPDGNYLVYTYNGASSDTDLWAPCDKQVSHVTFCWNKTSMCYEEETAWAQGERYVRRGNWAMYVAYPGTGQPVDLIADGGDPATAIVVGTATFSAPIDGKVTITINLTGGAIFYYDVNDPWYDNNLKVQDYKNPPAPKNPKVGRFEWKTRIEPGSTTGSITVPENNFYGVHLDVAVPVPCQ